MLHRYFLNITLAYQAILENKLRALLTTLGVVFGVASVVAMLAIGQGTREEINKQMEAVGTHNLYIRALKAGAFKQVSNEHVLRNKGLTPEDAQAISSVLPNLVAISPESSLALNAIYKRKQAAVSLIGVEADFFEIHQSSFAWGRPFAATQLSRGDAVCIIGKKVAIKFFSTENALGKYIKCGKYWMKVIGVLEEKLINAKLAKEIGVASTDWAVCVPMKSFILRFNQTPQTKKAQINHELDRIIIKVAHSEQLVATAQVVNQMLARRHPQQNYYKVIVPEELIKRQRKTRRLFNIVLGAIAGISLLVGGIGIMNIMYASASERTRELGVRIVAGATRQDIITQFLAEAILICFLGGLIGILLGIGMGITINKVADIPVVISLVGVFWAFVIATFTGIFFGIQPARKAARNNPIESLRYE